MPEFIEKESIWKRLTRLFRSGPVVRHKIASGEPMREPQGTARAYKKELSSLYVHSLASYGQYERLSRYADYGEMEFTPEIASAIDIYADETTVVNDEGRLLNIVSKSSEIKQVLETLFYDILNIEFNIWSWVRNLVKYGDFFLFVDASEQNGILNLLPIPINELEREEGFDKEDPFAIRFRWLTQGNKILENWQIIHFRLLGNDNFLPYGSSVIEPARRIWRQLILIEDAMLVYRIVRSPERRVFYIDVGSVNPNEVDSFMEQIKNKLRRNQVVDPASGRVDLRYNPLSVDEDYFLPTRGDRSNRIETLAGGQFTGDIDDVQYIQNKLFAALKVPKAYLGYEAELGSKATLSQQDVRFARTIERIQKIVIAELQKIALLHLFMLGYEGSDLTDFEIKLANPSSVAEQQKLELWRMRFEIAGAATEGMLDRDTVYRKIFNMSDEEISKVKEGKKVDKLEDLTLEGMQLPAEAGAGGGEAPEGGELPGAENLPSTLGGAPGGGEGETPPPAETPAPEGVEEKPVIEDFDPTIPAPESLDVSAQVARQNLDQTDQELIDLPPPAEDDEIWKNIEDTEHPDLVKFMVGDDEPEKKLAIPTLKALVVKQEKRNPGNEGDDASVDIDRGKDKFSTGEDQGKLVFGTEKQTASDPNDKRALKRLVTRPFSEGTVFEKKLTKELSGTNKALRELVSATKDARKIQEDFIREVAKQNKLLRKYGRRGGGGGGGSGKPE